MSRNRTVRDAPEASTRSWHDRPAAAACADLNATPAGLAQVEALERLRRYGPNALPAPHPPSPFAIGLRQLRSPLIYILLAAAAGSLLLGRVSDAGFIGFVLLVNSLLGGWQEWNAERQSLALRQLMRIRATVLRDGEAREIDAEGLVPGDVVTLESGQRTPADLRLLTAHGLEIDEALLTGESLPVAKDPTWAGTTDAPLGDRRNMAHAGSTVVRGRGFGLVVETGLATQVGRVAVAMTSAAGGKPPLTERMERFSRAVAVTVLCAALVIGLVAVFVHDQPLLTMFTFGVALAVSAIPEALPVAVTIALAIAARRMASRGAIVRQLPAVEGLGSCTLIASDKTGTLTCNQLTVRELRVADGSRFDVTGAGYEPLGEIVAERAVLPREATALHEMLEVAVACNEAHLSHRDGAWISRGDPTDRALLALAGKRGVTREAFLIAFPETNRIPFEPERQFAATFHRRDDRTWIAVKGAPERVLALCAIPADGTAAALRAAEDMAARGLRVLALASGRTQHPASPGVVPETPRDLAFAGLVGLIDPLRPEARASVRRCNEAGIRVIMVTGDHPITALAIARDLGIATGPQDVVAGFDLAHGDTAAYDAAVRHARVFARVTPAQKLAIVEAAERIGHFVAVTGDGVNDAPALRRANIGVAMGRSGTDVAREAADLVLSDDNFATIVAGVEEGRVAYQNIRNVVYLLTAAGIAEVVTVGAAVMVGLPLPLLPVQLLWLNLVTNGIQDVGLAFERGGGDELRSPPRSPREPIFNRLMLERGLLAGFWMSVLGLTAFVAMLSTGLGVEHARNNLLLLMVLMQNVDAVNARSETHSVLTLPLRNNPLLVVGVLSALSIHVAAMYLPLLQGILGLHPPTSREWLVLPLVALTLLFVMEAQKFSWRWRQPRRQDP
jgi:magnesium-transporting ATPase (P-type)